MELRELLKRLRKEKDNEIVDKLNILHESLGIYKDSSVKAYEEDIKAVFWADESSYYVQAYNKNTGIKSTIISSSKYGFSKMGFLVEEMTAYCEAIKMLNF